MGRRRKERRIAASSGRRVILDLSAEPSGELGSSSAQDEDGGAEDAKKVAGLPSSPSSSGKPENPLALLGQYSDDELDDGSSPEKDQAIAEVSRDYCNENQEKGQNDATMAGHMQVEEGNSLLNCIEKSELGVDAAIVNAGADEALDEKYLTGSAIAASTSYLQDGDVYSGWKAVLHEESNQYYYWNVATGETSWTVPDALLVATANDTVNNGQVSAIDASYSVGPNFEMTGGRDQRVTTETIIEDVLDGQKIDTDGTHNYSEIHSSLKLENVESAAGNLASCAVEHGELLLEKLHSIKEDPLHGHPLVQSYLTEVEMRLADMKSLECHGSSLLPFWELSENRLQQLEANINAYLQEIKAKKVEEIASADLYPKSSVPAADADSKEDKAVSALGDTYAPELAGRVEHLDNVETDTHQVMREEHGPLERHFTGYSGNASEEDMDVDMEVEEDSAPLNNLGSSEPLGVPDVASASLGNSPSGEGIPPPPDEDWIPPPPPDDEPFPPPPPDEPPEVPYPQPSDLVSVPSYPYLEQYSVYPGSHFQYVAQTSADVAGSHVYAHTEGYHQPAVSQPPVYFGALPDTYATATLAVNPVESGLYYGIQDPAQQPFVQLPVLNHLGSSSTNGDLDYASMPKGDVEGSVASGNSPNATLEPLATTMPVTESVSSIPASTATTSTSLSPSKAQPKVLRKKKKTVAVVSSLRSNKKVSSLVDKWKAAKEEMQEEEKEPQNPLEILERKRQREIEEWRKQQIASGEAKENANFQPLGGDWRERVKRKRAKLAKESVQSPAESVSEVNPQPNNLDEHSKGLPKGWQAYWDDSTKQVYYGNTLTSETSWTRPTD